MAFCKDPRLTHLNEMGYNVVRLPRQGIRPLGVIGKDDSALEYLGSLDQIWDSPRAVPPPGPPNLVAAVNGTRTSDIKLSLGLEILANALSGLFGVTAPSLDIAFKDSKTVQFRFTNVREVSIDPFAIGNYLSGGDLRPGNAFVANYFGRGNGEAFLITNILQSNAITVIGKDDGGTEVSVKLPELQKLVGIKGSVTLSDSTGTEITFTGTEYVTFGFKVFGIGMSNGMWQVHGVKPDASLAFEEKDFVPDAVVLTRNGLLDLKVPVTRTAGV